MDKVSITITTDKPVKIRVVPDEGSGEYDKEATGLKRLFDEVNGGGNVVHKRETRAGNKKQQS